MLFGIVMNVVLLRRALGVAEAAGGGGGLAWTAAVPLAMAVLYVACWVFVLRLWQTTKRRENQIFVCDE